MIQLDTNVHAQKLRNDPQAWCGGKEVPDGVRRFGNWWPFAFGLLCVAYASNSRDEEERSDPAQYEVGSLALAARPL
jgi:hypothetical protein